MSMKGIYLKEFNQASWDSFSELFEELGQKMDPVMGRTCAITRDSGRYKSGAFV